MKKEGRKSFVRSFGYAFCGIGHCIKTQRNMRIHLSAVVLVSYFSYHYGLERWEWLVLLLCFGAVLTAEAFNTAIETAIDLCSPEYHPLARIAKDAAAGAVLISALISVAVGVLLYFHPQRLWGTLRSICMDPLRCGILVVLAALAVLFIVNGIRLFGGKSGTDEPKESLKDNEDKNQ